MRARDHRTRSRTLSQEMESINTIVRDTKIVKALEEEAQRQTRRVDDMQLRLERELQGSLRRSRLWPAEG